MKRTIVKNAKILLLAAFVIGAFGQTFSTASVTKTNIVVKTEYPLPCTYAGDVRNLCHFTVNGGAATADGCLDGGTSCSVWI